MTSKFDGLDNELLNFKDVIIENIQAENIRLRIRHMSLKTRF